MKRVFSDFAVWLALFIVASGSAQAGKTINTTWTGLAVKGYDVVAYFNAGKPVKGESRLNFEWAGATWRFSSEANRDAFKAAPEKYAPQFGGYCAWAVSRGYTADIDPEAWKILNSKLYLNYSAEVQAKWQQDAEANIAKGETNWPALRDK